MGVYRTIKIDVLKSLLKNINDDNVEDVKAYLEELIKEEEERKKNER